MSMYTTVKLKTNEQEKIEKQWNYDFDSAINFIRDSTRNVKFEQLTDLGNIDTEEFSGCASNRIIYGLGSKVFLVAYETFDAYAVGGDIISIWDLDTMEVRQTEKIYNEEWALEELLRDFIQKSC